VNALLVAVFGLQQLAALLKAEVSEGGDTSQSAQMSRTAS
jgi:hypothetical protein